MSSTVAYTELLGRSVITLDDAELVGSVKSIVIDRAASRVERLQIAGRKRSPELVDWARIHSVGTDAVMIKSADYVHDSRDAEDDLSYTRGEIEIIGAKVVTTRGFFVGEVTDLHLDDTTGEILAAMTSDGRISGERIKSLGTFGLVVD